MAYTELALCRALLDPIEGERESKEGNPVYVVSI